MKKVITPKQYIIELVICLMIGYVFGYLVGWSGNEWLAGKDL